MLPTTGKHPNPLLVPTPSPWETDNSTSSVRQIAIRAQQTA
jgi:hypothetical protein